MPITLKRLHNTGLAVTRMTLVLLALAGLIALPGTRQALAQELFGITEHAAPCGHPLRKNFEPLWERVLSAEKSDPSITAKGAGFGPADRKTWGNLVQCAKAAPEAEILHMVNGYFNQWSPQKDNHVWNTPEYWTTPREFLAQRGGDCEDYAIAKYFALRFLGLKAERMRIVVVRQKDPDGLALPQLHAVLAVRRNNTWFILDNNARPRDNVFPHNQYQGRFQPLFSINEDGCWIYGQCGAAEAKPAVQENAE